MNKFLRNTCLTIIVLLFAACSRTATEAAIQVTGLPIPADAKVIRFVDSAGGVVGEDLALIIELELTSEAFVRVERAARSKGYLAFRRPLRDDSIPVDFIDGKPNAPNGYGSAMSVLQPGDAGLFLGKGSAGDGSVATLDLQRRRLIIVAWIL